MSNLDETQEKELRFKALENIINKIKGETTMEKWAPLFEVNTPLKRDKYSELGEKAKIYSS